MTLRTRLILTTTSLLALGGLLALLPLGARSLEPREVIVIARQMSFYVGDGATVNPIIQVAPGERIRITLINADPGFDHDFAVRAWDVRTPVLHGEGRTSLVIQAPDTPGAVTYVCSLHDSMMKGTLEVVASRAAVPAN
jgi:FtsP/CotA-like multicopper oxidase with cupredoxin domain